MAEAGLGNFAGDVPRTCRTLLTDVGSGLMYKVCSTSGCPHLVSSGSLCDECRKAKDKRRTRGRNPYTSKAHRLARARAAGKGSAVRLSRRRAGRMRKAPWPMRCPQHHSRPLADRTHRARRSRLGPQRPATHARPVQALPRQQDRKDETFGLQQQTKPQLTHTGFGTKTKHSIEAKPTTPAARVERHERRKRPSLFVFHSRLIAAANESNKKRCKTNGSKPSKHPRGYPLNSLGNGTAGEPVSEVRRVQKFQRGRAKGPAADSEGTARGRPTMEEPCHEEENASGPAR